MSDFDAQDVLRKVDENHIPADWKVHRARESYFYGQISIWVLFTVMLLGASAVMVLIIPLSQAPIENEWLLVPLALLFVPLALYTVRQAFSQFSQLRTIDTRVCVLTPKGCVARTGPKPNQIYGVAYAQVAAIAMSVQHSRYESNISLILTYIPDSMGMFRRVQWRIDPQFQANAAIAQAIIEAHTRYAITHASAPAG